jgi:hypothetical protein
MPDLARCTIVTTQGGGICDDPDRSFDMDQSIKLVYDVDCMAWSTGK